jgi:hypothetical protein
MALVDLQRRVAAVCLGAEPAEAELAQLGDPRIWSLYRRLVRGRLRDEHKRAFKRTHALLGREAFEALLAHHLALDPPRTRFFYGIPAELARSGVPYLRAHAELPAHAADLLAYEAALWTVSDLPDLVEGELDEVSFERVPLLAPALRLLALAHAVHEKDEAEAESARPTHLCIYRRPQDRRSRTWVVNGVTFDLLTRCALGTETLTDSVKAVCLARKLIVDEKFMDGLGTVLASAIERGVLLGSR